MTCSRLRADRSSLALRCGDPEPAREPTETDVGMVYGIHFHQDAPGKWRSQLESSATSPYYSSSRGEFKFNHSARVVIMGDVVKKETSGRTSWERRYSRAELDSWSRRTAEVRLCPNRVESHGGPGCDSSFSSTIRQLAWPGQTVCFNYCPVPEGVQPRSPRVVLPRDGSRARTD